MIKDIITANENVSPNDREITILKEYFPACFKADGSFDLERFKEGIKDKVDVTHEGYELRFLGKSYAKLLASLDTTTVIKPDMEHNEKPENKNSQNVYISGDNLDGLKHLLKSYHGNVKCIYIDPPYNTGTDGFVYKDNFNFAIEDLVEKLSLDEIQAQRILDLTKRGSASDSAWLMFMYSRLQLAFDLLSKDGVIFISIDDWEQANLKLICDDIFGNENFVAQIIVQSNKRGQTYKQLAKTHEYLLVYTKNSTTVLKELQKSLGSFKIQDDIGDFSERELRNRNPKFGRFNRPNLFYPIYLNSKLVDKNGYSHVSLKKTKDYCIEILPFNSEGKESCWRWGKSKFEDNNNDETTISNVVGRIKTTGEYGVYEKYRKGTYKAKTIWFNELIANDLVDEGDDDIWEETGVITEQGSTELRNYNMGDAFDFPKPTYLIKKVFTIGSEIDSVCVDFFSGSATSTEAIMDLNARDNGTRKIIAIQLPEDLDIKLVTAPKTDKPKIQKVIDFLDTVNRPHTLDQVGMERIIRAVNKIKEDNSDTKIDLGFKHYTLFEPSQKTLDKLESFEPNTLVADATILDEFGKPALLTTWLVRDGYGFNAEIKEIDLGGYITYHCGKHLYFIDGGFEDNHVAKLVEKYENDGTFNPENIVMFGYSFNWSGASMLETNLKLLKDTEKNLKINIDVRH